MWPLLRKDGLGTQYIALTLLWNRMIGHSPFISLRQATFLDVFTWVRQIYHFIHTSAYSTLWGVGGLSGMRPASPAGVCLSTTGKIPRLIPRPQRTFEHTSLYLRLVVEHQVNHRGALDRWWT